MSPRIQNKCVVLLLMMILLFSVVLYEAGAHEAGPASTRLGEAGVQDVRPSAESIRATSIRLVYGASMLLIALIVIAMIFGNRSELFKKIIFILIVIVVVGPTAYFIVTTISINLASETGGPVHWHADFKIFACGEELSSLTPVGLSNKIGTPLLHEHEDRRIHVEGVVGNTHEVSLGHFFEAQGGELAAEGFRIPAGEGFVTYMNGDACPDGDAGVWQAHLYKVEGDIVRRQKLEDYTDYVISPEGTVPPGDCIIFEFGAEKDRTDNICDLYQVEINKGNLHPTNDT